MHFLKGPNSQSLVQTFTHSEGWLVSPSYSYQEEQIGTSYFTGSEFTFVRLSHCNLRQPSWSEKLKTAWDSWKYATLLTLFWIWRTLNEVCFLIYIWKQGFGNICIRWWRISGGIEQRINKNELYGKKKKKISRREPRHEGLSRNDSLVFRSTLFKSISGSQGKAAWGAYIRFMSFSLSQDRDKKPQEACGKSVSKSVSTSERD